MERFVLVVVTLLCSPVTFSYAEDTKETTISEPNLESQIPVCIFTIKSKSLHSKLNLKNLLLGEFKGCTYILLTKRKGRTARISVRVLDSTALGPYKKDRGQIFSQYGPEQAWLIRYLLHD